ncbi:hypothetical protein Pa4123_62160 [Phytohabitans aurantiacus]|uniref:Transposase IS701-like DDE domain-containing protein n=1 Tax=Phytohabitans aurantiacus TaxID=3016789 RepID=A0ABQ5R3F0_9ACTN|nr:hypothetical protein Pa4123_62160 [Phytohabitans aurantiacus]
MEPSKIDDRLKRMPCGRRVQWPRAHVDIELAPAQRPGEVGHATVAGDQGGEVAGRGGTSQTVTLPSPGGPCKLAHLLYPLLKRKAGRPRAGNERKPPRDPVEIHHLSARRR